jgi:hypothetical protein
MASQYPRRQGRIYRVYFFLANGLNGISKALKLFSGGGKIIFFFNRIVGAGFRQ